LSKSVKPGLKLEFSASFREQPVPTVLKSLIQSDFGGASGNFEAVILQGDQLVHWFRDNTDPTLPWRRGQVIVPKHAAGAGSIVQSDFGSGPHGNFEVVVPLFVADGTQDLWHYFHNNSDANLPWQTGQRVASRVMGPGCIIQSDFRPGKNGNFEVVVPQRAADGTINLQHFWHDNSDADLSWRAGQRIAAAVAGPGTIIQSDFVRGGHGNFEVTAMLRAPDGGIDLWHFWHDNSDANLPWQRGQRIAANVAGPGVMIQSDFRPGANGNFEVVVRIGSSLRHFWHDNSDANLPWRRGQVIADAARGWGALIQSNYVSGGHGNFEVLAEECTQSVVHYWHPNQNADLPWLRDAVILGEPYPAKVAGANKVAQLTGEYDREGWNGSGTPPFAFNRTESRFGIRGCDLGSSFEHEGRLYFLFGDTWRVNQTLAALNYDSIAFCTDTDPSKGLNLTFLDQPPLLPDPHVTQGGFDVPLDGLSRNGAMYVFFSSNSYRPADGVTLMGRSVLGRSNDGGANYSYIGQLSNLKFINVSVETGTIDQESADMTKLPVGTLVLWIWGTGRYRASDIYLSVMPLANMETLQQILYFAGDSKWSSDESDAAPLFCAGDLGEISVRWNPFLSRWLALFNSSNPRGILMHTAPQPWGPWSQSPVMIFDSSTRADPNDPCSGAGYGRFMHIPWNLKWNVRPCDHVQDDVLPPPSSNPLPPPPYPFRDNDWGGEYGPYQIARFATGEKGRSSRIWFTMSTWNPYQVMLMTALITSDLF
jgi:hypothetical protein